MSQSESCEAKEEQEGRKAYLSGQSADDCPYHLKTAGTGNPKRFRWFQGYFAQRVESKFPELELGQEDE